jgi:hypothetical protein
MRLSIVLSVLISAAADYSRPAAALLPQMRSDASCRNSVGTLNRKKALATVQAAQDTALHN